MSLGTGIRDPGSGKNPFRIPGSKKRHRIPDPDPHHCKKYHLCSLDKTQEDRPARKPELLGGPPTELGTVVAWLAAPPPPSKKKSTLHSDEKKSLSKEMKASDIQSFSQGQDSGPDLLVNPDPDSYYI
jgi:hypothetical protein